MCQWVQIKTYLFMNKFFFRPLNDDEERKWQPILNFFLFLLFMKFAFVFILFFGYLCWNNNLNFFRVCSPWNKKLFCIFQIFFHNFQYYNKFIRHFS